LCITRWEWWRCENRHPMSRYPPEISNARSTSAKSEFLRCDFIVSHRNFILRRRTRKAGSNGNTKLRIGNESRDCSYFFRFVQLFEWIGKNLECLRSHSKGRKKEKSHCLLVIVASTVIIQAILPQKNTQRQKFRIFQRIKGYSKM